MSEYDAKLEAITDENWPEELLQKYAELKLPSLFDFLVHQEKLAAEIRRQNKELINTQKNLAEIQNKIEINFNEKCEDIKNHFNETVNIFTDIMLDAYSEASTDEDENDEDDKDYEDDVEDNEESIKSNVFLQLTELTASQHAAQQALMQSLDLLLTLFTATQEHIKNIQTLVPEKQGFLFRAKPEWRLKMETSLESYSEGIKMAQSKLLAYCADASLEVIAPAKGQPFDPNLQRAVERIPGGIKGQIAGVVRYGYRQKKDLLRYADVSVYQ